MSPNSMPVEGPVLTLPEPRPWTVEGHPQNARSRLDKEFDERWGITDDIQLKHGAHSNIPEGFLI